MSKPVSSAASEKSQAALADQMAASGKQSAAEGKQLFDMALPGLQQAESYYGKLSTGDPNALARANAPAVQAITKSTDSAKKNIVQDMPRGGERNLALEEADLTKGAQIGQLETGSYLSSFGSLAGLGGQNVGQGNQATSTGVQSMNAAANQYGQIQQINAQNKAATMGMGMDAASTVAEFAAMCWIAEALWEKGTRKTEMVRFWLREIYSQTAIGNVVVRLYRRYGQRIATQVRAHRAARAAVTPLFNWFLLQAQGA